MKWAWIRRRDHFLERNLETILKRNLKFLKLTHVAAWESDPHVTPNNLINDPPSSTTYNDPHPLPGKRIFHHFRPTGGDAQFVEGE